jgi:hypothetical protein
MKRKLLEMEGVAFRDDGSIADSFVWPPKAASRITVRRGDG